MDRDALSYAFTMQGEHAMKADRARRDAAKLRKEADSYQRMADEHEERAAWFGEMADALATKLGLVRNEDGDLVPGPMPQEHDR